ncbi:MAG: chemotaxis protein CheW [Gammaproteobacteria bacterium]|jgi:purine-binding chemotaxis protein CheW|nr:chemotaxis protein CheW [Gammaproteobacteria bacterium]MBT3722638.1 chemotaxis protein CheW [Gammaproteobacteria bacterium]MBT4076505.1 chemotaxis protein CheW [Gammaproteobacteria bacterium]MBT4451061.1 chemotaxis protein CheW [Gammaproteobacteria bacterium]MBT4860306.1 chemotaxis protein CheW [Gammaproteobacteria bacterium]
MNEIKMPKKYNSGLLNPDSAVEDFLDTLLQESTEKPEKLKPVRSKSNLLLLPELEVEPAEPEIVADIEVVQLEEVTVEAEEQSLATLEKLDQDVKSYEYSFPIQCLMFSVAGNQLSIPLINMGSVLAWGDRLTLLPDAPDWFLGILQHREMNVKVVDTAKIIHINENNQQNSEHQHILVFGDDNWAITCDKLGEVIKLNEDDVKWSKQESKNLALGTIKESLATLLDPNKILNKLNEYDDKTVN